MGDNGTWRNRIVGEGVQLASQFLANPANWRVHPQAQRDAMRGALNEVGWVQRVIVNRQTGYLLDGHERVWQALQAGDAAVPYVEVDLDAAEEAYVLATLDPIGAMAQADGAKLAELLRDVQSGEAGVQAMLAELAQESGLYQEPKEAPEAQVDRAEELREKWQTERGQLWQIGRHRLLCGDSTSEADGATLMGGEKAELCLTDPPYATGGKSEYYDIQTGELPALIASFLPIAREVSERVLLTPGNAHQFEYPKPTWVLAWFVQAGVGANPWGFTYWNAVFAYGADPYLERGMGSRPDAFVKTEAAEKTGHPTSKPVGVWKWLLERGSVDTGDIVYDPFLGSGTTMVAAEQLGRVCYGMEIEPKYVAVALERMATMGLQPRLEG